MAGRAISADEARWRAESDAETMARYNEIMGDSKRRNAAMKAAKEKASQLEKSYNNMKKVAGTKGGKRK